MGNSPGLGSKWRLAASLTLTAKSCASVNRDHAAPAAATSAVGTAPVEARRGDQVSASDALMFGHCFGQRRNRIVAHELRKKRQLARLVCRVSAEMVVGIGGRLVEPCLHDRRSLPLRFAGTPNCAMIELRAV
jgi:hypothetical protein